MPKIPSISKFFQDQLGAPFRNQRWSWGSVDEHRKRVFLRLWADDRVTGSPKIRVLEKPLAFDARPGLSERKRHVELIRAGGYSAFGVLCDRDAPGGSIRSFNSKALLRLGGLVEDSEFVYAIVVGEAPASNLEEASPDRRLVESLVRPRAPAGGQAWGGSAESRKAIENHAMSLALRHYGGLWREVIDVSATQPFDLLCRDGDRELRVEVKGTTSLGLSVLLTRNEVRHAEANDRRMALFVVSEITAIASGDCSGGIIWALEPWDIHMDELDPVAFECRLRARPNRLPADGGECDDAPPRLKSGVGRTQIERPPKPKRSSIRR